MRLVESIPATWKLRGRVGKYIHKRALAAWLPPAILYRRKLGFAEPVDLWFQGGLHAFVRDALLGSGSICTQLFRPAVLAKMLDDHARRHRDYTRELFSLLAFAVWHRRYVAGAAGL
jgi:asparagine synthase (glutamine-hydrolysing)